MKIRGLLVFSGASRLFLELLNPKPSLKKLFRFEGDIDLSSNQILDFWKVLLKINIIISKFTFKYKI
jgi:hypothetical protein